MDWLERPEWATRIRAGAAARRAAEDEIDEALRAEFAERDHEACLEALAAAGVPAAPVVDPRTLALHSQLVARGFLDEVEHPVVGRQATMSAPFRYASVEHWLHRAAPTLGEHNHEVLVELGYEEAQIEALAAKKVIGARPDGL